ISTSNLNRVRGRTAANNTRSNSRERTEEAVFADRLQPVASQFVSHGRAKHQAPTPSSREVSSLKTPNPKQWPAQTARRLVFELGTWCLFGVWNLELGAWARAPGMGH